MLDRLTNSNLGEGVVDFKMYNYQVERLVNNNKALVGVIILVIPISANEHRQQFRGYCVD